MNNTTTKSFETLGKLAVICGDSTLASRLDTTMTREQYHSYLNGVDAARIDARAMIEAVQDWKVEVNSVLHRLDTMTSDRVSLDTPDCGLSIEDAIAAIRAGY